jgi:hypothetical protein
LFNLLLGDKSEGRDKFCDVAWSGRTGESAGRTEVTVKGYILAQNVSDNDIQSPRTFHARIYSFSGRFTQGYIVAQDASYKDVLVVELSIAWDSLTENKARPAWTVSLLLRGTVSIQH